MCVEQRRLAEIEFVIVVALHGLFLIPQLKEYSLLEGFKSGEGLLFLWLFFLDCLSLFFLLHFLLRLLLLHLLLHLYTSLPPSHSNSSPSQPEARVALEPHHYPSRPLTERTSAPTHRHSPDESAPLPPRRTRERAWQSGCSFRCGSPAAGRNSVDCACAESRGDPRRNPRRP